MSVLKTKRNIANTAYCFEARKFYLNFKSSKPSKLRAYPDCKNKIIKLTEKLDLKINKKKTHIKKISQGFQFLKAKFFLIKKMAL